MRRRCERFKQLELLVRFPIEEECMPPELLAAWERVQPQLWALRAVEPLHTALLPDDTLAVVSTALRNLRALLDPLPDGLLATLEEATLAFRYADSYFDYPHPKPPRVRGVLWRAMRLRKRLLHAARRCAHLSGSSLRGRTARPPRGTP